MDIIAVGDFVLADNDLRGFIEHADGVAYSSSLRLRERSRQYPVIEDVSLVESERTIFLEAVEGAVQDEADQEAMNLLVRRIFRPSLNAQLVTGRWNGGDYQNYVWFKGDARPSPSYWEITAVSAVATWESTTLNTDSTSPLTVGGNAPAQPLITITGGDSCTRYRVVASDNTGSGLGSYMIAVPVTASSASNIICYQNGLPVPFSYDGTRVYLRAGTRIGRNCIIDIYAGSGVSNTGGTVNGIDAGGLTLDSDIASGIFKPAIEDPFEHPLSAALSWHPGKVIRHDRSRAYTFGWDGQRIRLVDRESTGTKVLLPDDMDAVVLTSPVGLQSISGVSLTARAGYREGRVVPAEDDETEKVMKVTIATIDGSRMSDGPKLPDASGNVRDLITATLTGYGAARNPYLFYAQFQFGNITFPNTYSYDSSQDPESFFGLGSKYSPAYGGTGLAQGTVWRNDYLPWELPQLAAEYLGCTVENGDEGVYYLRFPAGAFRGIEDLPLLSMSLHEKGATYSLANNDPGQDPLTIVITGDASLNDVLLFESEWVDPVTLEPLDNVNSDAITDDPLIGKARVSIWSRGRYSEDWTRRWTSSLTGSLGSAIMQDGKIGIQSVLAPGSINLDGDTQVAIGLEPSAADPNHIEWAELEIGGSIQVTTMSAERPTINVASVAAQALSGGIINDTVGVRLDFERIYSDATGLEIDTSALGTQRAVRGASGVGPWYGILRPSGGNRLFDLDAATDNAISKSGDMSGATVAFAWRDRIAW